MSSRGGKRKRPKQRATDTAARVKFILRQPWGLDSWVIEGIAQSLHDAIDQILATGLLHLDVQEMPDVLFLPAELLAALHGYMVIGETAGSCGQEGLLQRTLFVRKTSDMRRWALRIYHELAHALLRRRHGHTEADVWALTLALAVPRRKYRHLDVATHIPAWARDLRRLVGRYAERAA